MPGLAAFALVIILAPDSPWLALPLAAAAWLVVAVTSYVVWRRVREAFGLDHDEPAHPRHRPATDPLGAPG